MMMLNPPTFVEHNNDFFVNGTNLRCSHLEHHIDVSIKNGVDSTREDLGIK